MPTDSEQFEKWMTLLEAAEFLNVHPSTLRRWANNGDIPVMLTPGGHRRFAESDITRFAQERHSIFKPGRLEKIWASQALEKTREEISARHAEDQGWLDKFDPEARKNNRILGQRLMALMLQYISEGDPGGRLIREARNIGHEYGRNAMAMQLPLPDALQASMFFRDTLISTTHQMPDSVRIPSEAKMRLLHRINTLLNTVQLAVAEVYDANKADRLPGS